MLDCRSSTLSIDVGKYLTEGINTPFVDTKFYKKLVGQLMFAINSRFDICFVVGELSRFMTAPQYFHLDIGFQILQYLKGTFGLIIDHRILFKREYSLQLQGYPRGALAMIHSNLLVLTFLHQLELQHHGVLKSKISSHSPLQIVNIKLCSLVHKNLFGYDNYCMKSTTYKHNDTDAFLLQGHQGHICSFQSQFSD